MCVHTYTEGEEETRRYTKPLHFDDHPCDASVVARYLASGVKRQGNKSNNHYEPE